MGREEPGPHNRGKTWPEEAHKQPQLATQYYPCAVDEESLRIRNKVHRSLISIFSLKNTEFFEVLVPYEYFNFGLKESIKVENGFAHLPTNPGLGIDLDWDFIDNSTFKKT